MAVTFQQLVEKLITDPAFRQKFHEDRVAAVQSLGINVTTPLRDALDNLPVKQITAVAIAIQGPADFT
jgi:hypothetical protein